MTRRDAFADRSGHFFLFFGEPLRYGRKRHQNFDVFVFFSVFYSDPKVIIFPCFFRNFPPGQNFASSRRKVPPFPPASESASTLFKSVDPSLHPSLLFILLVSLNTTPPPLLKKTLHHSFYFEFNSSFYNIYYIYITYIFSYNINKNPPLKGGCNNNKRTVGSSVK